MLKYNIVKRRDPRDQSAAPKFYASIKRIQSIDLDYIANELAEKSSVTKGDVMSIVTNLIDLIPKELSMGRTVNLGRLGTFWLNINSDGYETEEEVTPDAVKKVNVRFRPSSTLKELMRRLRFDRLEFI